MADRVALVTGASAGIGRATADCLAAAGWSVVGASRRGTGGQGWTGIGMDVDDDESVRQGTESVLERHGRIDALVACAGWGLGGALEHSPLERAKAQMETNFWGSVRSVQAVLPGMRARGSGRVVLMSSIGGAIGIPFQSFYCASKFALEGLGESLAYEVAPFGIRVTLVQPGNVRTEFTDRRQMVPDGDPDPADPYTPSRSKAIGTMERDERNGVPAEAVGAAVRKFLDARRPPRRVSVGRNSERVGLIAKRLLPYPVFEAGARSSLGV